MNNKRHWFHTQPAKK